MGKRKNEKAMNPVEAVSADSDSDNQQMALQQMADMYQQHLDDTMGHLYNQFVAFIAESKLPLPQVLLVLEMLILETQMQARKRYIG